MPDERIMQQAREFIDLTEDLASAMTALLSSDKRFGALVSTAREILSGRRPVTDYSESHIANYIVSLAYRLELDAKLIKRHAENWKDWARIVSRP